MSDGNFNRALLPSTPYRSGVKMGQQQMRARAVLGVVLAVTCAGAVFSFLLRPGGLLWGE